MEENKRGNLIVVLSNKYYDKIFKLGGFSKLHQAAIDVFGVYEVVDRVAGVLLAKAETEPLYDLPHMTEQWPYIKAIAKNVLNNLSKRKQINDEKRIVRWNAPLLDMMAVEDITTMNDESAFKEPALINALSITIDKLYETLHLGKIQDCEHLARYYRKLLARLNDERLRYAYEALLHQFYAELFLDIGKLKIAQKHAQSSIYLYNKSDHVFGHTFIANAYNILVLTYLNKREYKAGNEAYEFNVSQVQKSKETRSDIKELLLNKINLEFSMFCSTIPNKAMSEIFREAMEFDTSSKDIHKSYALIYNLLDQNKHEQSLELIDKVKQHSSTISNDPQMDSIRADVAIAESYTMGFTSYEFMDEILAYCELAEQANITIQSKYFKCIIEIIRGYALKDNYMVTLYCNKLSEYGYLHYSNWYKRRAIKNI